MTSIADFEALLKQTMGLDAASVGITTIERAVQGRMAALSLHALDDYLEVVRASFQEHQELIEAVVVPETWFFRDTSAFAQMVRFLTEERLSQAPAAVVKLLSIPCSTGEEPYSMAMALIEAGVSERQIRVDAVDISKHALERAQRAVYGRNSFRNSDAGYQERFFRNTAQGYALSPQVKDAVAFHSGNVTAGLFPPMAAPYDVVFCRNLLIYFDRPTQETVMRTLGSLLSPAGLLFVGAAEAYLAGSCGFTAVTAGGSFAFRKSQADPPKTVFKAPKAKPVIPPAPRKAKPEAAVNVIRTAPAGTGAAEARPVEDLAEAQRLADLGRLQEAIECCERSIAQHGPSAQAYYLMGVARDASGDRTDAAHYLRRSLYLDPVHVDALTHLALLMEAQSDKAAARRLRERAKRASALGGMTRNGG